MLRLAAAALADGSVYSPFKRNDVQCLRTVSCRSVFLWSAVGGPSRALKNNPLSSRSGSSRSDGTIRSCRSSDPTSHQRCGTKHLAEAPPPVPVREPFKPHLLLLRQESGGRWAAFITLCPCARNGCQHQTGRASYCFIHLG